MKSCHIKHNGYKTIGILCTGNELVEGRVLNTNGQLFAFRLFELGMSPGMHLTISDLETEIESALKLLLTSHDAVIICGGLGPTSDDRTRDCVARVAEKKLILNEQNWQAIQDRLKQFNMVIHPSNQQQAFFPEGARIFENSFGTAAGFGLVIHDKPVFVLPGPPHECLPLFERHILPDLIEQQFNNAPPAYFARLIGVSEADIAYRIDTALKAYAVETAFCWQYPFCDVVVKIKNREDKAVVTACLDDLLQAYCVSHEKKSSSQLAREQLAQQKIGITIDDTCSGGLLYAYLFSPQTKDLLNQKNAPLQLTLSGLTKWHSEAPFGGQISFEVTLSGKGLMSNETYSIPYRAYHVRDYAVEYAAFRLLSFLKQIKTV